MNLLDEYRRNARECQRMAENAANSTDKASWLRLAASWLSMIRNDSKRFAQDTRQQPKQDEQQRAPRAWPASTDKDSKVSH